MDGSENPVDVSSVGTGSVQPVEALPGSTCVRHATTAAGAEVDGEFLVLRVDTGAVIRLNRSGAFLWESMEGATIDSLSEKLQARFGIELERAEADVRKLVSELARRRLVEVF